MRTDTGLWADLALTPGTVSATVAHAEGFDDVAALLTGPGVRRVIVTGNGAQWHVSLALWLRPTDRTLPPVRLTSTANCVSKAQALKTRTPA